MSRSTGSSQRAPRRLFEYWGHEASLLPVALQPLLRWRMERAARGRLGRHAADRSEERPELVAEVLEAGPRPRADRRLRARPHERPRRSGPWWDWSDSKRALEWLFWSGQVTAARRRQIRAPLRPARARAPGGRARARRPRSGRGAQRELVRYRRARDSGSRPSATCATTSGCRRPRRKARVAELVEAGELLPGRGRGLGRDRRLPRPGARIPRRVDAPRADRPVRLADLGAQPGRADVRLAVPDRDLRAGAQARARLLRAAVPARRPARRPRRPESRPRGGAPAAARPAPRARARRRTPTRPSRPSCTGSLPGWDTTSITRSKSRCIITSESEATRRKARPAAKDIACSSCSFRSTTASSSPA